MNLQGKGAGWASLCSQSLTIPSTEKREAGLQSLQCLVVTAHTFMGCQTRSGPHSPTSAIYIRLHSCLEHECLSSLAF